MSLNQITDDELNNLLDYFVDWLYNGDVGLCYLKTDADGEDVYQDLTSSEEMAHVREFTKDVWPHYKADQLQEVNLDADDEPVPAVPRWPEKYQPRTPKHSMF